jgi:hypothetical protein
MPEVFLRGIRRPCFSSYCFFDVEPVFAGLLLDASWLELPLLLAD